MKLALSRSWTAMLLCVLAGHTTAADPGAASALVDALAEDAELVDVCFVDAERGWAVGDRGVIWHTRDGGRRWQRQHSGVSCRLESVYFVDRQTGWAAGGYVQPYTHTSTGVLLHTRDGGKTWLRDKGLVLPALRQVRFFSLQQGWAIGETSALFPQGVFLTDDGGRSWTAAAGAVGGGWLAGDFVDPHSGAVAGRRGSLAVSRQRTLEPSATPSLGLRSLWRMRLGPSGQGWLVGDGGLAMTTGDSGRTWQVPPGDIAAVGGSQFDWYALDFDGTQQCWIAGSPGTRVVYSPDGGQTWEAFATGSQAPLRAITFVDGRHGWAVGALGTILASQDGGRTWQRQRAGGSRAAVLGVFSQPEAIPLELFARLSGNDGYLGVVELVGRRDVDDPSGRLDTLARQAHDAVVALGGSLAETAWSFPLRQSGLDLPGEKLVETWNRSNDGAALDRLEGWLVRQIRLWRPEVVVTHAARPQGDQPLEHVINQLTLRAAQQAADPTRYPEHFTQMGLEAWRAKKVFGSLPPGETGTLNVTTVQLAPRLGRCLADQAEAARGLIERRYRPPPASLGFRLFLDDIPQGLGSQDFFSGTTLNPGGDARRLLVDAPPQNLDLLRRMAQKQRNVQAILEQSDPASQDAARLAGQLQDLCAGLDAENAGEVLYQLGQRYHQSGRWNLAADTFNLLASQYPDHPLAPSGVAWLVQYWSSGEVAWQIERVGGTRQLSVEQTAAAPGGAEFFAGQGILAPPGVLPQPAAASAGQERRPSSPSAPSVPAALHEVQQSGLAQGNLARRAERAAALGKYIETVYPALHVEPAVQFPLAAAWREQGLPRQADRYYASFTRGRPQDAWSSCAACEQWLARPEGPPPKSVYQAAQVAARPRLDGVLDDAAWQRARPMELTSALGDDADWPAVVLLSHDQDFLYLAAQCRQAPGLDYPQTRGPRGRDADLAARDRIDLLLDADRDWTTYYRLTVDHRGWTAEDCWHDTSWNPQWYVAARTADGVWTIEAAIAWEELAARSPQPREAWAVGVQRTAPGVGFQSWTTPASVAGEGAGFGIVWFD